jgi:hypothetical protein
MAHFHSHSDHGKISSHAQEARSLCAIGEPMPHYTVAISGPLIPFGGNDSLSKESAELDRGDRITFPRISNQAVFSLYLSLRELMPVQSRLESRVLSNHRLKQRSTKNTNNIPPSSVLPGGV